MYKPQPIALIDGTRRETDISRKRRQLMNKKVNPNILIRTAKGFLNVGRDLSNLQTKKTILFLGYYVSPCITNLSFACELFLKAIIMNDKKQYTEGHRLFDELYSTLSTRIKKQISDEYDRQSALNSHIIYSFSDCLHNYNNAFCLWRYGLFEGKTASGLQYDLVALNCLALSLESVCDNLYQKENFSD